MVVILLTHPKAEEWMGGVARPGSWIEVLMRCGVVMFLMIVDVKPGVVVLGEMVVNKRRCQDIAMWWISS